jgi:uncharacterized protein (DUF58 family)
MADTAARPPAAPSVPPPAPTAPPVEGAPPRTEDAEPLLTPAFVRKLEQFDIAVHRVFAGRTRGERRSKRRGQSVEFADHKNYVVGDDLRHIDWNIFARLERLFVKLFLEEEDITLHVLIDASASMDFGSPTKGLFARRLAAALGYIGLSNMNRVSVQPFAAGLMPGTPVLRGKHQTPRLMDFLEGLRPQGVGSDLLPSFKSFAVKRGGQGVVVVISDFFDKAGYERAFSYLLGLKMDVYVVHLLAEEEVSPDFVGDLKLIDAEDGDEAEITVSAPLLAKYRATVEAFRGGLRDFCTRRGMQYLFVSNRSPFEQVVLTVLRRQGLLR